MTVVWATQLEVIQPKSPGFYKVQTFFSDFSCRLPESCKLSVLLDGVCDKINANPGCQYDGGSCPDTPDKPRVDLDFCYENILGDSVCDGSNNILQCNFDNGDCVSCLSL